MKGRKTLSNRKNLFKAEKRIVDVKNVSENMPPYIFFLVIKWKMSKEVNRNRWSKLQVQHTPNRSYRNTI